MGALSSVLLVSCSESELEDPNKGVINTESYYQNYNQAYAGLAATYDILKKNSGGFDNMITMMNAGSDDQYAGGGSASDGAGIQGFSNFTLNPTIMPGSFWSDHYKGIYRANILISKVPGVNMNDSYKVRFTAEAKALRALYYFNLVRMFKNVPLITSVLNPSEIYNVPQAAPSAVYAQIESDLIQAIPDLPMTVTAAESGRLSRGAAKALLGKVYLYEGKNALAAAELADVNGTPGTTSSYGYKLLTNFSDLWVVSNKFNTESIIEVVHTNLANSDWGFWGSGADEGNSVCVMVGPRSYSYVSAPALQLPSGWCFNVFTQNFYDFMVGDPRFSSTIYDAKALKLAGNCDYVGGYLDTGYFLKKYLPTNADISTGGGASVLNYQQNSYVIRLADSYLMEAEALGGTGARAQALLDAVRTRVGLASVPVSLAAIKAERRKELAGEGQRFFDLVRWGDAPAVLGSRGFVAGKNEIFPIPFQEMANTILQQNPNY